jgi:hypothetical protein
MRALILLLPILLAACGGGGSGGQVPPPVSLPDEPVVTVDAGIKQLIFNWEADPVATYYRLLENPDGSSGFTQVGDELPAGTMSVTIPVAVHLMDWLNAEYIVEACNSRGCNSSDWVNVQHLMPDTIGYFKASNTESSDLFGASVALSGDGKALAVGAREEDSNATGINGDQSDNSADEAGAVYLFRFDGVKWYQQAYIKASNAGRGDRFGYSVSLNEDGTILAVGAPFEDSASTGLDGDQNDDSAENSGAVYLYRVKDQTWYQDAYIKASTTGGAIEVPGEVGWVIPGDNFGRSIALSADGRTLAVGAPNERSDADGINGDQDDDSLVSVGAAYIFRLGESEWQQQAYIKASNSDSGDRFGQVTLSADGNLLAVGTPSEDSGATGIDGSQSDNTAEDSGATYVFRFDGNDWVQQAYIKASNTLPNAGFGTSTVLNTEGDSLAVGTFSGPGVCIFRLNEIAWNQQAYIVDSEFSFSIGHGIGLSLAGDGNILAVTSPKAEIDVGAAHIFQFQGESWVPVSRLSASNAEKDDYFGGVIDISTDGNVLAIGAAGESSASTGINGDQSDNFANDAGAVYLY